ncbi:MAG TPA: hypothetical protein VGK47_09290 [Nitrososphaeraceae archaeon]
MTQSDSCETNIKRNPDGTFVKGFSANPGGKLSAGLKQVRDFAQAKLGTILIKMYELSQYTDDDDLKFSIWKWFVDRAAGKAPEAPIEEDDGAKTPQQMTGEQLINAINYLMQIKGQSAEELKNSKNEEMR